MNALNDGKIGIIAILVAGALCGIISFSHLLSWLLKKFHHITMALLSGFMIGSLNKIWPWKITVESYTDSHGVIRPLLQNNVLPGRFATETALDPQMFWAVLLALAGFGLIFLFEVFSKKENA